MPGVRLGILVFLVMTLGQLSPGTCRVPCGTPIYFWAICRAISIMDRPTLYSNLDKTPSRALTNFLSKPLPPHLFYGGIEIDDKSLVFLHKVFFLLLIFSLKPLHFCILITLSWPYTWVKIGWTWKDVHFTFQHFFRATKTRFFCHFPSKI